MSRTAESLLHETEYWQLALNDIKELNELIVQAARPLPEVPVEMLTLILGADAQTTAERVGEHVRASMAALGEMDAPICRLLDLVQGRLVAMRGEFEHDDFDVSDRRD